MKLKIADNLSLPLEALTQTFGVLAKRRAGKSYMMRRFVEQLLKAGQQVVLVDPKGDQWGIRSAADGKSAGFPIIILGGEHADVPLEVGSGEIVAKLVVEERVSILIDLSLFRKHEVATFMTAFLENLYRLKAKEIYRTPLMLVLDEADAIAPQKPQKGEERMLGAAEDIVRRGGQRGIGCMLVTQRSAVLNKNVLTQSQILVALRTIAPQDLDAMKAWIEVHGTVEQQKILMASLPSLPTGDAWFWSPGWPDEQGIFERVHVLPIETFDSAATPKPGEKRIQPKKAAEIDLDALRRQMASTIQRAKENDPAELKKRIRELERERAKKAPIVDESAISRAMERAKQEAFRENAARIRALETVVEKQRLMMKQAAEKLIGAALELPKMPMTRTMPQSESIVIHSPRYPSQPKQEKEVLTDVKLGAGARRLLGVLVGWYPNAVPEGQWRALAGLRKTGTYGTYKSALRSAGLIEETSEGFKATDKALEEYKHLSEDQPTNTEEVITLWEKKLGFGARRMLGVLVAENGNSITEEELLERAELRKTGTYGTYKSQLRTAHLIIIKDGMIAANKESLFL